MTERSDPWTEPTALACEWVLGRARMDRMLAPFGERLLKVANLQSGETAVDIGCGTGTTTLAASKLLAPGGVTGVDISESMIDAARKRWTTEEPRFPVEWVVADAQTYPFPASAADAFISRFGVAHFADVHKAFSNMAGGLRSGGRIVLVEWSPREENEWRTLPTMILEGMTKEKLQARPRDRSAFGSRDALVNMLRRTGLERIEVDRAEAPMWVGESAADVLQWFLGLREGRAVNRLSQAQRLHFCEDFLAAMRQRTDSTGVYVNGSAWVARAVKRSSRTRIRRSGCPGCPETSPGRADRI